ncbi:MAG: class I SAM-dependent methyltransferase, partial [Pseudomonadota bacterium]
MGLWDRYVVPAVVSKACASKPIMKQREKVVPLAEGRVLELGCGTGSTALLLAPSVAQITGTDISGEMVRIANGKAADQGAQSVTF